MNCLPELFEASKDSTTHRVCGTCGDTLPFENFYRDGKDGNGNVKYRRDCKNCYKRTRMHEANMKQNKCK